MRQNPHPVARLLVAYIILVAAWNTRAIADEVTLQNNSLRVAFDADSGALAYGQKIDALRRKYKAYLWDGEYRDTLGATVSADGSLKIPARSAAVVLEP